jgi:hypothetical protein
MSKKRIQHHRGGAFALDEEWLGQEKGEEEASSGLKN